MLARKRATPARPYPRSTDWFCSSFVFCAGDKIASSIDSRSLGCKASVFKGMSFPLIRSKGGRMGFKWRSDASFLAMNFRSSTRVKCPNYSLSALLAPPGPYGRAGRPSPTIRNPAPGGLTAADRSPEALDFDGGERLSDGRPRRDPEPRLDVASGDSRGPPARPDPAGEGRPRRPSRLAD